MAPFFVPQPFWIPSTETVFSLLFVVLVACLLGGVGYAIWRHARARYRREALAILENWSSPSVSEITTLLWQVMRTAYKEVREGQHDEPLISLLNRLTPPHPNKQDALRLIEAYRYQERVISQKENQLVLDFVRHVILKHAGRWRAPREAQNTSKADRPQNHDALK